MRRAPPAGTRVHTTKNKNLPKGADGSLTLHAWGRGRRTRTRSRTGCPRRTATSRSISALTGGQQRDSRRLVEAAGDSESQVRARPLVETSQPHPRLAADAGWEDWADRLALASVVASTRSTNRVWGEHPERRKSVSSCPVGRSVSF